LTEPPAKKPPADPRDRAVLEWLGTSVRYAGALIVIALLYLLSFGPADRYCNKVVTRTSAPATFTSNTYTSTITMVTVRYPLWVGTLYRPAIYLRLRSEFYRRYIDLWNRGDEPK